MKIDLHTHTYYSDGSFSPKEVIDLAIKRGVKYLAITDHDVITGLKEAEKYSKRKKINYISGIEISSKVSCSEDSIHLVGLYINRKDKSLRELSNSIIKNKNIDLKEKIIRTNKHFNSKITLNEVKKKTKGQPGIPHLAMVLLDKNYIKSIQEGIKLFTKNGKLYSKNKNKNKKKVHAKDAIKIIHDAGGLAILAHLSAYKNEGKFVSSKEQETLIKELSNYGLDGIEIYIPDTIKKEISFGEKMAKRYNLKLSGGSDFHDEKFIPSNKLGIINLPKDKINILK